LEYLNAILENTSKVNRISPNIRHALKQLIEYHRVLQETQQFCLEVGDYEGMKFLDSTINMGLLFFNGLHSHHVASYTKVDGVTGSNEESSMANISVPKIGFYAPILATIEARID
jgi:hypothetical protein